MEKKKKYINSVMNFTGSKYKLLDQLLPLFDYSKDYFVDMFCGGGSIYMNVVDKYHKILINDIIEDLIGIHENLIESNKIIENVKKLVVNKEDKNGYLKLRNSYNEDKSPEKLWALMLCCTNNLMRFNQKFEFNQSFGKRSFNNNTQKKIYECINHIRPYKNKLVFKSTHFENIQINNPNTMVYLDPPYGRIKNEDGTLSKKQISEAGYNAFWLKEHDKKLYEYIHNLNKNGSSFLVSGVLEHNGNVSWMLDKLIKDGFNYKELKFNYNKVSRKKHDKQTKEIIIMNY